MPCSSAPLVFADSMGIEPFGGAEGVVAGVVKVAAQEVRVVGQCGVVGHGRLLFSYPEMHYGQRENKRQVRIMDTHARTHAFFIRLLHRMHLLFLPCCIFLSRQKVLRRLFFDLSKCSFPNCVDVVMTAGVVSHYYKDSCSISVTQCI